MKFHTLIVLVYNLCIVHVHYAKEAGSSALYDQNFVSANAFENDISKQSSLTLVSALHTSTVKRKGY